MTFGADACEAVLDGPDQLPRPVRRIVGHQQQPLAQRQLQLVFSIAEAGRFAQRWLVVGQLFPRRGPHPPYKQIAGRGQAGAAAHGVDHGDRDARELFQGGRGPQGPGGQRQHGPRVRGVLGVGPQGRPGRLGHQRPFHRVGRRPSDDVTDHDRYPAILTQQPVVEVAAEVAAM